MMWQEIEQRLKQYQPSMQLFPKAMKEAAVLVPIIKKEQPEIILTLRSNNLSTHKGEVAFPGGKRDPDDIDLQQTALRESKEEIALLPDNVEIVGSLQTLISKHHLKVTPYVGFVDNSLSYKVNTDEIASIFTVPLDYFREDPRVVTHRIDYLNVDWYIPCYQYHQYRIWGLTAIMIAELVNIVFETNIVFHEKPVNSQLIDYSLLKK